MFHPFRYSDAAATQAVQTKKRTTGVAGHNLLEPSLISEPTRAGVKAAQRRGAKSGRKLKLTPAQIDHARKLIDKGDASAGLQLKR
jgi:hypothetical protein